jgi:bacteriorhodopsin
MRKAWFIVFLLASSIMAISSNVETTQTHTVSSGFNVIFYFVFLWFLFFIVPTIGKKE